MNEGFRKTVRTVARICGLVAAAVIISAVSHVNMAVAGIGGIGGGKGGGGKGRASLEGEMMDGSTGRAVAGLSIIHLQDAIQSGKSESEIRALANEAGYALVIS
jgi:hypothetical protein